MCGIAGFVGGKSLSDEDRRDLINRMCGAIMHRGPDDQGVRVVGDVALGMRRLSIIDVAGGHQPISNEDGSVTIVFNGEIYNYRELRKELAAKGHRFQTLSDTETVVHAYEEYGAECVNYLRGMFAFAIWDERSETLTLARDRVGKKPLHYAVVNGSLIFGSEIKSLLAHPAVKASVNFNAISSYLSFGYISGQATAFQGITKIPPGHILTFRNSQISLCQYWDFNYGGISGTVSDEKEREYIAQLRELLTESVRLRLVGEVPLGAFLSGGIDSSTVVAFMARMMDRPVKTFSIGFTEGSHDELEFARLTASRFKTQHHEFVVTPDVCQIVEEIVWHHDEPFADVSSIPTYVVSKMAREYVTIVLSGDGGDEIFGGYERYLIDQSKESSVKLPRVLRRDLFGWLGQNLPRKAYGKNYLRNLSLDSDARYIDSVCLFHDAAKRELLSPEVNRAIGEYDPIKAYRDLFARPASLERLDHLLYLDSKTYLPGDILTKVDRMSMAHSVETRCPLLDHKLIEFAQSLPACLKVKGRSGKYILKQAMAGIIPDKIIHRRKQGFAVPIRKWFRDELREMLHDILTDTTTRNRRVLNPIVVETLIQEHQSGRRDNSHQLWALLALELWFRRFIDRGPVSNNEGGGAGISSMLRKAELSEIS